MAVDQEGTRVADEQKFLLGVLERIGQLVNSPDLPNKTVPDLKKVVAEVLDAATHPDLNDLLGAQLKAIAVRSPEELIAAANPAVRLLKRRPKGEGMPEANHFRALLAGSEGYASEEFGDFMFEMNPYFSDPDEFGSDEQIEQQIQDARDRADIRQGGPFRLFNSSGKWESGTFPFSQIPKPGGAPAGSDQSWYMLTRWTPKDAADNLGSLTDDERNRLRNVVKTVEIQYGPPSGIFTGEMVGGQPKKKPAHVFFMYAGGNGT